MDVSQSCFTNRTKILNEILLWKYMSCHNYELFFRLNRDAKQNLEMDWSDKKESLEIDSASGALRNEHTNKQFYPGAAKFQEM